MDTKTSHVLQSQQEIAIARRHNLAIEVDADHFTSLELEAHKLRVENAELVAALRDFRSAFKHAANRDCISSIDSLADLIAADCAARAVLEKVKP